MNDQPRATTGLAIRTGLLACILGLVLVGGSSFASGQTAAFDGHAGAGAAPRFKASAFDYLVLFNADSVVTDVERVFPGRGVELANLWRTCQFEYSWLRSMSGRYVDFLACYLHRHSALSRASSRHSSGEGLLTSSHLD